MKKTNSKASKKKTLKEALAMLSEDNRKVLKSSYILDDSARAEFARELKELYMQLTKKNKFLVCCESKSYNGKFEFDNLASQIIWQFVRLNNVYNYILNELDDSGKIVFSTASAFGLEIESYSSSNFFLPRDDYARFSLQAYLKTDDAVKDIKALFMLLQHFDAITRFTKNKSLFFFHPFLSLTTKREIFNCEYVNEESKESVINHKLLLDVKTLIKMISFIYLCPKKNAFEGSNLRDDLIDWTYAYREITEHNRGDFQQKEYIDHFTNAALMIKYSPFCFFNLAIENQLKSIR